MPGPSARTVPERISLGTGTLTVRRSPALTSTLRTTECTPAETELRMESVSTWSGPEVLTMKKRTGKLPERGEGAFDSTETLVRPLATSMRLTWAT